MTAWLVTNGFTHWSKFEELFQSFLRAASTLGIKMKHLTTQDLVSVLNEENPFEKPDFVLFWDKDIYLASLLELRGFRVFNSSHSIQVCDNKALTCLELQKHHIAMPKTILVPKTFESLGYNDLRFYQKAKELLSLPMVLKEVHGSFGWQVYLIQNDQQAEELFLKLRSKDLILQEFIKESSGKDIRAYVVGDTVVASMLRINENDFRSNLASGGKAYPCALSQEQEQLAISAVKACDLDFAGVDILLGEKPYICEVNSNAHFQGLMSCTHVDVPLLILSYIQKKIKEE